MGVRGNLLAADNRKSRLETDAESAYSGDCSWDQCLCMFHIWVLKSWVCVGGGGEGLQTETEAKGMDQINLQASLFGQLGLTQFSVASFSLRCHKCKPSGLFVWPASRPSTSLLWNHMLSVFSMSVSTEWSKASQGAEWAAQPTIQFCMRNRSAEKGGWGCLSVPKEAELQFPEPWLVLFAAGWHFCRRFWVYLCPVQ